MYDGSAFLARKEISLNCERITRGNLAVRTETAMQKIPIVLPGTATHRLQGTVVEIFHENAVVCFVLDGSPILRRALRLSLRASGGGDQASLCIRGLLGDDIDHS